jgi:hypothetical protein
MSPAYDTPSLADAATLLGRLARLGLSLPPPVPPIANFVTHVREGSLLILSGQGPCDAEGCLRTGKVGRDVSVEQAYEHARLTGLNLTSMMQTALRRSCGASSNCLAWSTPRRNSATIRRWILRRPSIGPTSVGEMV